jgi:phage shock protein PspC (stress-responsive transcriptional regulator)
MSTFGDTQSDTTDYTRSTQYQATDNRTARPPLRRSNDRRMIGGVCSGIADYLAVDVTIVRVAFVAFTFLGAAGIPAYLACLLLIPEEGSDRSIAASLLDSIR